MALMEATEAYSRNTGRNVTVLPPGLVFAYNWHQASDTMAHSASICRSEKAH